MILFFPHILGWVCLYGNKCSNTVEKMSCKHIHKEKKSKQLTFKIGQIIIVCFMT
jgi:hypothetical protein